LTNWDDVPKTVYEPAYVDVKFVNSKQEH